MTQRASERKNPDIQQNQTTVRSTQILRWEYLSTLLAGPGVGIGLHQVTSLRVLRYIMTVKNDYMDSGWAGSEH